MTKEQKTIATLAKIVKDLESAEKNIRTSFLKYQAARQQQTPKNPGNTAGVL